MEVMSLSQELGDEDGCNTLSRFNLTLRDEELLPVAAMFLSLSLLFIFVLALLLGEQLLSLPLASNNLETPRKKKYEPIPAAIKRNDSA